MAPSRHVRNLCETKLFLFIFECSRLVGFVAMGGATGGDGGDRSPAIES